MRGWPGHGVSGSGGRVEWRWRNAIIETEMGYGILPKADDGKMPSLEILGIAIGGILPSAYNGKMPLNGRNRICAFKARLVTPGSYPTRCKRSLAHAALIIQANIGS